MPVARATAAIPPRRRSRHGPASGRGSRQTGGAHAHPEPAATSRTGGLWFLHQSCDRDYRRLPKTVDLQLSIFNAFILRSLLAPTGKVLPTRLPRSGLARIIHERSGLCEFLAVVQL